MAFEQTGMVLFVAWSFESFLYQSIAALSGFDLEVRQSNRVPAPLQVWPYKFYALFHATGELPTKWVHRGAIETLTEIISATAIEFKRAQYGCMFQHFGQCKIINEL